MNIIQWVLDLLKPQKTYWAADPSKKFDTALICANKRFPNEFRGGSNGTGTGWKIRSNVWDRNAGTHVQIVLDEILGECGITWKIVYLDAAREQFAILSNDDGNWIVTAKLMDYGWLVDDLVLATDRRK